MSQPVLASAKTLVPVPAKQVPAQTPTSTIAGAIITALGIALVTVGILMLASVIPVSIGTGVALLITGLFITAFGSIALSLPTPKPPTPQRPLSYIDLANRLFQSRYVAGENELDRECFMANTPEKANFLLQRPAWQKALKLHPFIQRFLNTPNEKDAMRALTLDILPKGSSSSTSQLPWEIFTKDNAQ